MNVLVSHLKHAARRLQRSIEREAPPINGIDEGESLQRRHCLQAIAARLGFHSWTHARDVLEGTETVDRGTLMYRDTGGAIWNIWSASYDDARSIRADTAGFLLPYKQQFQVVEAPYIAWLGLEPTDPDWEVIRRDWVRPADVEAWRRIALRRIEVVLGSGETGESRP